MVEPTILRSFSGSDLDKFAAEDQARKDAVERQNAPVITGLAHYVRSCWDPARMAKMPIETRMLKSKRQRNGEYEPEKIAAIRKQGGSDIFMPLTEVKCRSAESWIRDILLDKGPPPWELKASPYPSLNPDQQAQLEQEFIQHTLEFIQSTGAAPEISQTTAFKEMFEEGFKVRLKQAAQHKADMMQCKIEDQLAEGGWYEAFNDFVTDLTTYPTAFIKGPVIRQKVVLTWGKDESGKTAPTVERKLQPQFERVDPFRIYPEPGIETFDQGYCFEHKPMTRSDVSDLIGVPGFDDDAIRLVLNEGPRSSWFFSSVELTKNELEAKHSTWYRPDDMFDCLEFWGKVSGKMLRDWGVSAEEVPDTAKEYNACVWMIGNYVIKAMLNYDPLGQKPYHGSSMYKVPGAFWGRSIPEAIEGDQVMINNAARSLANNMGIASGPQVEIHVDRLAPGEDMTEMFPWKQWQMVSDKSGSNRAAINFFQPDSRAAELWTILENFSKIADEHSGIPSYVSGDIGVTGAGRTSSGLSMLMGAAGKGIRQVVTGIDGDIVKPIITKMFIHNMRYDPDEKIKGDAFCVPLGAVNLAAKETDEVRKVEFLNATANPFDIQIMGPEGRAAVLRDIAKTLHMPDEEVVPQRTKVQMKLQQQQMAQVAAQENGTSQMPAPGQETPLLPDGSPAGGAAGTTVRNQMTGAS